MAKETQTIRYIPPVLHTNRFFCLLWIHFMRFFLLLISRYRRADYDKLLNWNKSLTFMDFLTIPKISVFRPYVFTGSSMESNIKLVFVFVARVVDL